MNLTFNIASTQPLPNLTKESDGENIPMVSHEQPLLNFTDIG